MKSCKCKETFEIENVGVFKKDNVYNYDCTEFLEDDEVKIIYMVFNDDDRIYCDYEYLKNHFDI